MNFRFLWNEMIANDKNYPSRDVGVFFVIMAFAWTLVGTSFATETVVLSWIAFSVAVVSTMLMFWYFVIRPLQYYESKYGKTGWGDKWLEKH